MNKLSIEHFNKRITRQDLCNKRIEEKDRKRVCKRGATQRVDASDAGIRAICIISNGED